MPLFARRRNVDEPDAITVIIAQTDTRSRELKALVSHLSREPM